MKQLRVCFQIGALSLCLCVAVGAAWAAPAPPAPRSEPKGADGLTIARRATPVVTYDGGAVTVGEIEDTIADSSPLTQAGALEPAALREFVDRNLDFELELKEAESRGYREDARVRQAAKDHAVQLMISREINTKLRSEPPAPELLKAYFENNKQLFSLPELRRATLIVLQTEEDARSLLPQVQSADDGKLRILVRTRGRDVASKSRDGDLGRFDSSGRPEVGEVAIDLAVVKAAFGLGSVGTVSDVIRLSTGYGLVKLSEIRAGYTPSFEEVKIRVLRRYDDERYDKEIEAIAKSEREKLHLVVHDEMIMQVKLD